MRIDVSMRVLPVGLFEVVVVVVLVSSLLYVGVKVVVVVLCCVTFGVVFSDCFRLLVL